MDFEGRPFEVTAALLAMAGDVEKCRARRTLSGLLATKKARLEACPSRFHLAERTHTRHAQTTTGSLAQRQRMVRLRH